MNDDVRLGLLIGGVALIALAVLWWYIARTWRKRRLIRALRAIDPQERARAGIRLVELGLPRSARPLLNHVVAEQDARVRLAIALAVARRQWEPTNAARVRRLRDWASSELDQQGQPVAGFEPALTRISDMGGPRPTDSGPTEVASPPAAVPPVPDADAPIEWHPTGPT